MIGEHMQEWEQNETTKSEEIDSHKRNEDTAEFAKPITFRFPCFPVKHKPMNKYEKLRRRSQREIQAPKPNNLPDGLENVDKLFFSHIIRHISH
jgi:hypothetical protein